jgi:hypothetical protein
MVHTDFMMCVAHMTMFVMQNQLPMPLRHGNHYQIFTSRSSMLPRQRQELVEDALAWDADWVLFLDTDQLFPANTAHRLMQHGKDVVACNIATKLLPPNTNPNACLQDPEDAEGGVFVYSTADKHGLEKVWRVGCGVMMLRTSVFKELPKPWFNFDYQPEKNRFVGEDWWLCRQLERAGVDIWIDHDLSHEVGHEGNLIFTSEMIEISKKMKEDAQDDQRPGGVSRIISAR